MSVKVAVRCRPFNQREIELQTPCCIDMKGQSTILINLAFDKEKATNEKEKAERERVFNFDYSFWSHDGFVADSNGIFKAEDERYADQMTVYKKVGQEVLDNAWEGYHCCLFAYGFQKIHEQLTIKGQTGAGKSYSMIGVPPNVGIVPIACEEIFTRINSNPNENCEYEVQFSMLEIYNEKIQDLLIPVKLRPNAGLKVREHKQLGVYVENLSKYAVECYSEIQEKMEEGNKNRTIASTQMNASSSRAHTIIGIEFKQVIMIEKKKTSKFSMIYLVDLAGSEKIGKTGSTGDRLKEGCNINKSLHYLGMVISNLADKAMGKGKNTVTPYRDSALTYILKNALGGNSKTLMICAVSPAFDNYDESLSTLRYADQAKKIKLNAIVNESEQDKMIRELQGENARLKEILEKMEREKSPSKGLDNESKQRILTLEEELNQNKTLMQEYEKTYKEKLIEQKEQKKKKEEENEKKIDLSQPYLLNLNEDPQLNGKLTYELVKEKTFIGRKATNDKAPDIILGSLGIEPIHMVIDNDRKALWIEPFNQKCSKNSFLNGDRITAKKQLHHNDRLILGNNNSAFLVKIPSEGVEEKEITWEFALTELMKKDMERRQDEEKEAEIERKKEVELKMLELEEQFRKEKEETEASLKQEASLYQKQIKDLEDKIAQESQKQKFEKQKKEAQSQWEIKLKEVEQVREQKERERQRKLRMLNLEEKLKQIKENDKRWLLRKLKKHIPLLRELNLICKELKRRVCFLPKLNYQWYDLNELILNEECYTKQKKDILQIMVINAEENMVYVWPLGKFSNRYYMLKEVLDQYFATNELPELGKEDDPCWDPVEPVLIAQGYLMLKPLAYKMDNPASVTLVDDQGECGTLKCMNKINVIPTDESGNTPQCDVDGIMVEDPVVLLQKRLDFLIYVDMAMFNSNACYDSFVSYQLPMDNDIKNSKSFETKIFAGNSQSPKYDYNQHHTYKIINQTMLDYILHKNLCFQVFGYLDANIALDEWKEDINIDENFPNFGGDQSKSPDFHQLLEGEDNNVSYDSPEKKVIKDEKPQQVFQNQFFQPPVQQQTVPPVQQKPQPYVIEKKQNNQPQKAANIINNNNNTNVNANNKKKDKKDKDCRIF